MQIVEMIVKIVVGNGFIVVFDQLGGLMLKVFKGYGIEEGVWFDDEGMFVLIYQMCSCIIILFCFIGEKVIGVILFECMMDGQVDGKFILQVLIECGVVFFIKIDKGLEDEVNGVQMMKLMFEFDVLFVKVKGLGVFGIKECLVINSVNCEGIVVIVVQQIEVGL